MRTFKASLTKVGASSSPGWIQRTRQPVGQTLRDIAANHEQCVANPPRVIMGENEPASGVEHYRFLSHSIICKATREGGGQRFILLFDAVL